jgi:hypothetical protein
MPNTNLTINTGTGSTTASHGEHTAGNKINTRIILKHDSLANW